MLMFRFWSSDSRGSDKNTDADRPIASTKSPHDRPDTVATSTQGAGQARPLKRRRDSLDHAASPASPTKAQLGKRAKHHDADAMARPGADGRSLLAQHLTDRERVQDVIEFHFGYEVLQKHDELRLIDQELAKCQVALEQLRRCHLIPYPIDKPTPQQMLEISSGSGPAVRRRRGEPVPRWAPPFGVVDGPYARHYAKWLIPDPMFDGMLPDWQPQYAQEKARKVSVEGRTTRNSQGDGLVAGKGRPMRGAVGQKLPALPSGYPKDKAGPCVLKRSDGLTVKLVCLDCHRENFSSTQGFINHCRIAHRRDFKSHDVAAMHCGIPIDVAETGVATNESAAAPSQSSTSVHPLARAEMADRDVYASLRARIDDSLKMFHEGRLPGITSIPAAPTEKTPRRAPHFVASADAPNLSRLMKAKNLGGNLSEMVKDAKMRMDLDDASSQEDDTEDNDAFETAVDSAVAARAPVVMRVPARTAMAPASHSAAPRPASSKGRSPHLTFAQPLLQKEERVVMIPEVDVDMEADLSPNTLASINAPSLVSDDGESQFEDSDDGSSESGGSESLEAESISDVAEINIDEDSEPTRSLRHHGRSNVVGPATTVRLRKDDNKHVTFVSPVKNTKGRRARRV